MMAMVFGFVFDVDVMLWKMMNKLTYNGSDRVMDPSSNYAGSSIPSVCFGGCDWMPLVFMMSIRLIGISFVGRPAFVLLSRLELTCCYNPYY
jgi:hypothetical protein